jgi:hypothetical protein
LLHEIADREFCFYDGQAKAEAKKPGAQKKQEAYS